MTIAPKEILQAPSREWQTYSEYKDSEVAWLEELPAQWHIEPLKSIALFVSRGNGPEYVEYSSIPIINQACIHWDGLHLDHVKYQRDSDVSGWKGFLHQGDLMMNSTGTGTLGRAAIFAADGAYLADSHVTIIRVASHRYSTAYLRYLISTTLYQGYVYSALVSGSTNQIELSRDGLRSMPLISPPLSEQRAISTFLDRETQKIDDLIAKRERLIELLDEKRTALISRSVTKGLNPEVMMKDSGVEWLGKIPTHWKLGKLRHIARVFNGATPSRMEPKYWMDGTVPWLSSGKVNDYVITEPSEHITKQARRENSLPLVPRGSVLVGLVGQGKTRGMAAFLDFAACVNQNLAAVVPRVGIDGRFLHYTLETAYGYMRNYGRGGNQEALNCQIVSSMQVALPPNEEQKSIVEYLDERIHELNDLGGRMREHVEKLREYRTALISAAVTGKIDVRQEI